MAFTTIKYTQIYYKKLKFIKTSRTRVQYTVSVNSQEKYKQWKKSVGHYNCINLTVVHTYYCNHFIASSLCNCNELKTCRYPLKTPCDINHLCVSSLFFKKIVCWSNKPSPMVFMYFSSCLVQYCKPWMTPWTKPNR